MLRNGGWRCLIDESGVIWVEIGRKQGWGRYREGRGMDDVKGVDSGHVKFDDYLLSCQR